MKRFLIACIAWLSLTLPVLAACPGGACFWIGGTGTLNLTSDSAHWSGSSGGTTCSCEPVGGDNVTFDGSSGGGTVTVNIAGGTLTLNSITMGAFTGTLDFATNNNNVTLNSFTGSGTGTRTLNLGNGTWSLTRVTGTPWNTQTTTNLTFNANSSTISFTGTATNPRTFQGGGLTYNIITFNSSSTWSTVLAGSNTIATLTVSAPNVIDVGNGTTQTITTLTNVTGSAGSEVLFDSNQPGTQATISSANNWTCTWCGIRDLAFTGGGTFTANSSFNFGDNSGITVNAPSGGGGGGHVIGGGL